jgi:hypothetical protein
MTKASIEPWTTTNLDGTHPLNKIIKEKKN